MTRRMRLSLVVAAAGLAVAWAHPAEAGMASFTLSDIPRVLSLSRLTRMRVEAISFFLLVFLLSAAAVRAIWNGLRADFPRLPRLSYGKALGVVSLWGLLFLLVLTMISGARELMTPGAWEKKGATYQLVQEPEMTPEAKLEVERFLAMDRFRQAFQESVRGRYRQDDAPPPQIPADAWFVPGPSGQKYVLAKGPNGQGDGLGPIAYEPPVFGTNRLVLCRDGTIRGMTTEEIEKHLWGRAD
jgi:hypothetical protein